jgi:membrane fusion protein (multidrug efflux system)
VVVIPKQALTELQGIFRVFVVDSDNTVQIVNVTRGPARGSNVVIEEGLQSGQTIIVEGVQKVRAGMTVAPEPFLPPAATNNNPET